MPISTIGSNSLNQTSDLTINGQTVGKGGGNVATNTAHGVNALAANTSGSINTAIGAEALPANTSGSDNTAVGRRSGQSNTTGSQNTMLGVQAMALNTTGGSNTAVGVSALQSNTTASYNTAVGYQAGYSAVTADYNTFVGYYAGRSTTGDQNTFLGKFAGNAITTGSQHTIIGAYNGNQGGLDIRTSTGYIVLSDGGGTPRQYWSGDGYWQYNSNTQLRLPSTGGTAYIGYVADSSSIQVSYNSTGNGVRLTSGATSWSTWSDQRLKNVTGTYTTPLADISQLQPIKFTWKSDEENKPQVGILAQSVQPVVPEAVEEGTISLEDETKYLTVRYTELIPLMVASIKELKTIVDAQAAEIAELKAKVA